ncbi:hypothetical protein L0669_11745 [Flavobacterium bizetiae]|uniref:hypothetical protein n=1 Tax=Flavobacterium bizetiae TaxID=2704140 RepID=UPI0021E735DF|nr:hypothetical protein [Flavobacterium bizetiae]UTN06556.1 hypothetical protein L0669_11745 [Flavobacterium bizetiae]
MTDKAIEVLMTILLPLTGGGIGFLLKRYLDKKRELFNENAKERRQAYQDFVDIIIDIFAGKNETKQKSSDVNRLFEFYKKNILFAPPNVVNAFSDYMQYIYVFDNSDPNQTAEHIRKLTEVLKQMRKDLGLSNSDLGENGEKLMRAILKDFDTLL